MDNQPGQVTRHYYVTITFFNIFPSICVLFALAKLSAIVSAWGYKKDLKWKPKRITIISSRVANGLFYVSFLYFFLQALWFLLPLHLLQE